MIGRRSFLGSAAAALATFGRSALADAIYIPHPGDWRSFEVTTRLALESAGAAAQAWVPLPSFAADEWMRPLSDRWTTNAKSARVVREQRYGAKLLHLNWAEGEAVPVVEIVSRTMTRDRARAPRATTLSAAERRLYTSPTALIPTDGIVKRTSDRIVGDVSSDEAKARAIYKWVVENTYRNPSTRGCGKGDVVAMLNSGDLGGKCADINALYVGLVRAQGIPARDLYGLRVGKSRFGYKSLGVNTEIVTKAQHCRAEIYLAGPGWTATDPADVRKVMLEEPPGELRLNDESVASARAALFGASEGNWIAYNSGHDLELPSAASPRIDFMMYPQAEFAGVRCDCLDPEHFRYSIMAKELAA
jgi:transglutaminase-like putative cysteine protease